MTRDNRQRYGLHDGLLDFDVFIFTIYVIDATVSLPSLRNTGHGLE